MSWKLKIRGSVEYRIEWLRLDVYIVSGRGKTDPSKFNKPCFTVEEVLALDGLAVKDALELVMVKVLYNGTISIPVTTFKEKKKKAEDLQKNKRPVFQTRPPP